MRHQQVFQFIRSRFALCFLLCALMPSVVIAGEKMRWDSEGWDNVQGGLSFPAKQDLGSADGAAGYFCGQWTALVPSSTCVLDKVVPASEGSSIMAVTVTLTQGGTPTGGNRIGYGYPVSDSNECSELGAPHPVVSSRGEKYYRFEDARRGSSSFPLVIERKYQTDVRSDIKTTSYWDFTYLSNRLNSYSSVYVVQSTGAKLNFTSTGTNTYISTDKGAKYTLIKNTTPTPDQWELSRPDGFREIYSDESSGSYKQGWLKQVINPAGLTHSFEYVYTSGQNPTEVTITDDQTGEQLIWTLNGAGMPTKLDDDGSSPAIREYEWDDVGRLISVTYPNDFVQTFNYATANYNPDTGNGQTADDFKFLITGITEDDGTTTTNYSNVVYDSLGRVTTSELINGASGVEKSTFAYNWDWSDTSTSFSPTTTVTKTFPYQTSTATNATVYTFTTNGLGIAGTRNWQILSVDGAAHSNTNCEGTSTETTYSTSGDTEGAGFVKNKKDANGNKSHRVRDSYGRITTLQTGLNSSAGPEVASQQVVTAYVNSSNSPVVASKTYYGRNSGNTAWVNYRTETFIYDDGTDGPHTCSDASTPTNRVCSKSVTDNLNSVTRTWDYDYDYTSGVLTSMTIDGPSSDGITTYTYTDGNITSIEDPAGHTTTYADYNAYGLPETITDANGVDTAVVYDADGRVETMTTDHGIGHINAETSYSYLPNGLLDTVTSADGSTVQYIYNSAHQLISTVNNFDEHIDLTPSILDGKWTLAKTYKASGTSSGDLTLKRERAFDALGRLWQQMDANGDVKTVFGYDKNDNLTNIIAIGDYTNANRVSYRSYDEQNRITSEIRCTSTATPTPPLNCASGKLVTTAYSYDGQGNIASVVVKDASNTTLNTTTYTYNGFGELTEQVSPDSGTTTYHYNAAGHLDYKTDANSVVTHYQYDAAGRLTAKYFGTEPTGVECSQTDVAGQNILYFYDQSSHGASVGRLTCVASSSGVKNISYDALGRVSSKAVTPAIGSVGALTTSYEYNSAGALTQVTYPTSRVVTYNRNSTNSRLDNIKVEYNGSDNFTASTSGAAIDSFAYQPFGGVSGFRRNTEQEDYFTAAREYTADGLLSAIGYSISTGGSLDLSYGYDAFNNINSIDNSSSPEANQDFVYDGLQRLHQAIGPYGKYIYEYDAIGNRTSVELSRVTDITQPTTYNKVFDETYSYDSGTNRLNRILREDATPDTLRDRTFKYDDNGNRTGDRKKIYAPGNSTPLSDVTIVPEYGNQNRMDSIAPTNCATYPSSAEAECQ